MTRHLNKLPMLLAGLGLLATFAPADPPCANSTKSDRRVVYTCGGAGCQGGPYQGTVYSQTCDTWCCPNGQKQYNVNSCTIAKDMGICCEVNTETSILKLSCP